VAIPASVPFRVVLGHRSERIGGDIRDDQCDPCPQRGTVVERKGLLEQDGTSRQARRRVDRAEEQDDDRRQHAQRPAPIEEAVLEIFGQGERIEHALGVTTKAWRHEAAIEIGPDGEAYRDPHLVGAEGATGRHSSSALPLTADIVGIEFR
jgi:hypothetical protein